MVEPSTAPRRARQVAAALVAVGALAGAASGCAGPEPDRLKVGVPFDQPGLGLLVTSENVGLDTAVARHLARDLGHSDRDSITWVNSPGRSRAADVATGQVDLALGPDPVPPGRTGDVREVGPYLVGGLRLASASAGTSPRSLAGRTVCAPVGSGAYRRGPQLVPGADIVPSPTISTCLTDVVEGRAAAALEDEIVLRGYLVSPAYASLHLVGRRLTRDDHMVLVPATDEALCRKVTASLRAMVASGDWDRAVAGDLVTTGVLAAVPPRPVVHGCG